jgi:predicted O-methyltransferase YrrM
MDTALTALLDELARFGDDNDARETERPKRMLNITPDTGRLLSILIRSAGATRVLEVGTSNAYSTIWLADAVRETGGRVTTLESNPGKVTLARANLARAGLVDRVEIREGRAADTLASLPGPSTSSSSTPTAPATSPTSSWSSPRSSRGGSSSPTTSPPTPTS